MDNPLRRGFSVMRRLRLPGTGGSGRFDPDAPLLRLEGVTKRWSTELVLDDVDLELRPGAVTGIVGENGVGKTTLLRAACGILVPDAGTTRFRGMDIERNLSAYQRVVGLLSAGDRGLYARLTVSQNLDFCAGLAGLSRSERRIRMPATIAEFDLSELAGRRVDRLSMGQRQRVRMACIFLHEPLLVFLDEPRTSLDEAGVALLSDALARLAARGGAALLVSHERDEPLVDEPWLLREARLHRLEDGDRPRHGPDPASEAQVGRGTLVS
jgi:ABC-2 type transport system ATP-binding protein